MENKTRQLIENMRQMCTNLESLCSSVLEELDKQPAEAPKKRRPPKNSKQIKSYLLPLNVGDFAKVPYPLFAGYKSPPTGILHSLATTIGIKIKVAKFANDMMVERVE